MRYAARKYFYKCLPLLGILAIWAPGYAADDDGDAQAPTESGPTADQPAVAAGLSGPQVFNAICIACHGQIGVGGAPAFGDNDAWAPRIAQGLDVLIEHALQGYSGSTGIMPRKGGRTDLSDEEIIRAIEYMVDQVGE